MNFQKKYRKRAIFWAKILARTPGTRAIILSGSLARRCGNEKSDIDFFVISRRGMIWTSRFFIFLILKIFHRLAKPKNHAGQICPNHFISDDSLEIQEKNQYSAELFSRAEFLSGDFSIFQKFLIENRRWMLKFSVEVALLQQCDFPKKIKIFPVGKFAKKVENFLRKIQIAKIRKNPDFFLPGAKIKMNDFELRFHPRPKS